MGSSLKARLDPDVGFPIGSAAWVALLGLAPSGVGHGRARIEWLPLTPTAGRGENFPKAELQETA